MAEVEPSELIRQALARRPDAAQALVDRLYPVIQARVARVLWRLARASRRPGRQEVEDMVQEVFVSLFDDRGAALRAWDPARGLSLDNFVGLLAERHAVSVLRNTKRNPWTEDPTLDDSLDRARGPAPDPEPDMLARDLLETLLDRLRATLSPTGMQLFQMIYVDEQSVEAVVEAMRMSPDAVYAWRSRLRKLASTIAAELSRTPAPAPVRAEVPRHG